MTQNENIIVRVHADGMLLEHHEHDSIDTAAIDYNESINYWRDYARSLGEEITVDMSRGDNIEYSTTLTPHD